MAFDKLYYFDKQQTLISGLNQKKYLRHYFGELQTDFNFNFVCDGTKDSAKIIIFNYDKRELKPNTICWLESTNTWWVVKKDSVKRYAQELGGFYEHTISLVGAFELLNHRDLTNCGFNAKRYTYEELFNRLMYLSDVEFSFAVDYGDYIDKDQTITYLKTFENYTPASAIKEMFNGMNLDAKLRFTTKTYGNNVYLDLLVIYPISKSGNNETPISIDTFNDEAEQSSSDIESYGTRVISNVENCVCSNVIRYPTIGGVRLTSNESITTADNAILRIPNSIYEIKKIYIYTYARLQVFGAGVTNKVIYIFPNIYKESDLKSILLNFVVGTPEQEEAQQYINDNWDTIYSDLLSNSVIEIENGGSYNALYNDYGEKFSGDIKTMNATPSTEEGHGTTAEIWLNDKQHGTTAIYQNWNCIYWQQGNDKVENFTWLGKQIHKMQGQLSQKTYQYTVAHSLIADFLSPTTANCVFAIDYIPMADLKVKVDNEIAENDSKLFNQNGKMIDSVAISKLINSYSKEISSNEITRYKNYRNYNDIPKVSQKVMNGNELYIINNVSIDFYENDDDKYFLQCQFTMTKQVACKSTMISANTNIRDYECPQQNNIKRIQTYRDYIEFGYTVENNETPYLSLSQVLTFGSTTKGNSDEHTCFFSAKLNDNETYYYQIGATRYNLNKQFIEHIDFVDNNIIGYEAGVSYYLFSVNELKNILTGNLKNVNTPISYVDSVGELKAINIKLLDNAQVYNAYNSQDGTEVISQFVSLPQAIWNYVNADSSRYDISIVESEYNKDGLEVPVFEYACQVGDANGINFGADFLKGETATQIRYVYKVYDNANITQENAFAYMNNGTYMATNPNFSNNELVLTLTDNSSDYYGKTICFWCELVNGTTETITQNKQTGTLTNDYASGAKTLTLTHTHDSSTFAYISYVLKNEQQPSGAFARIDGYSSDNGTINYTLGANQPSAPVSARLHYTYLGNKTFAQQVGAIPSGDIEAVSNEYTITNNVKVFCGRYVVALDLYVGEGNKNVMLPNGATLISVSISGNEHNTISYRLIGNRLLTIDYEVYNSTSATINETISVVYSIGNVVYKGEKTINLGLTSPTNPTIESSGLSGYDNSIAITRDAQTLQYKANIVIYSQTLATIQSGLANYSYDNYGTYTENVSVESTGFDGQQTYNLPSGQTLVTSVGNTPTITLIGEYIEPIVSCSISGDTLTYTAYDNQDREREVKLVVNYTETYQDYEDIERQYLFSANNVKVHGTNTLTLKVNNWKLK